MLPSAFFTQVEGQSVQLQRIISRCCCQFYYANYGEVESETPEVPLPVSVFSNSFASCGIAGCNLYTIYLAHVISCEARCIGPMLFSYSGAVP